MIKKVIYNNFLSVHGNSIVVVNDKNQKWELRRVGISANEVKNFLKENGNENGIKTLIDEKKLIPIYGGEVNLG